MTAWVVFSLALVLVVVTAVLVWLILRGRTSGTGLALLGREVEGLRQEVRESLATAGQRFDSRLDSIVPLFGDVQNRLGELAEASRKMFDLGKDIASLQDILRAPKLRGGLGEFLLGDLLGQVLPQENFSLPYSFKSGERVDAAIRIGQGIVPVDAKFPLENFRRMLEADSEDARGRARKAFSSDVKRHIDDIARKYILPDEGTYDFALMYIPAENVYYETAVRDDSDGGQSIAEYARQRRVIPVSPSTFMLYLQTILLGLRGMRVEKTALEVLRKLGQVREEIGHLRDEFSKLGGHLSHAQATFAVIERRLERFAGKLQDVETASPGSPDG